MDALPCATTVARVLLGLGRAEASGCLEVRSDTRTGSVRLRAGQVSSGSFADGAVDAAEDLVIGLSALCLEDALTLRFRAEAYPEEDPEALVDTLAIAMQLMRVSVRALDPSQVRSVLGVDHYRLAPSGGALLGRLTLRPAEQAVAFWLTRGVHADEVSSLPGCGLRGYRFLCTLKLLGVAVPRGGGSYPLMLRKRRQMRADATARELLDLSEEASGQEARKALRRLVQALHPDRFGGESSPGLRRASSEIVSALIAAEARIGAGGRG